MHMVVDGMRLLVQTLARVLLTLCELFSSARCIMSNENQCTSQ